MSAAAARRAPSGVGHQTMPAGSAPTLARLVLRDFRNYAELDTALPAGPVVLYGPNGAGKTNLLEAISMLSPGRGLRRAALPEIDRDGQAPWHVEALVDSRDGPLELATWREPQTARRQVRLFDRNLRGPAALAELFAVSWLTPSMDRLFADAAASRRRYLDRLVLSVQPDHAARVAAFERSLRERTAVLRDRRADAVWLAALERRIAEPAIAIAAARLALVDSLNPTLADGELDMPAVRLAVVGELEGALQQMSALDVEQMLIDRLAAGRRRDADLGGASIGPHRSELEVVDLATGEPVARISTGRQKAVLLAITLAQARLRQRVHGDFPIMLMDEVVAHLDAERRDRFAQSVLNLGGQILLTGTDRGLFQRLEGHARFLRIDQAQVSFDD